MKRLSFFLMTIAALVMSVVGCKPDDITPDGPTGGAKVVGTFKQADIVAAAADLYNVWLENSDFVPSAMTVGTTELTQPQYIYALAKTLVDIQAKKTDDVEVLSYKMAEHPERDSYDQLEIAVFNGPKNGTETEDLGNIAARMIAAMESKGQVPNQTLFARGETNIAFSTNRATVCMLRAFSEYKPQSKMPEKVSADYLSTAATIKGFATEFVKYLDVWENSVTDYLSADGTHRSDMGTAWENAHFIPIPYTGSAVNADGTEQFDPKFQPYYEPTVAGVTYTAAQCWGIALKSLIDLCSLEGSTVWATERTPDVPAHTLGNGKSMSAPIPSLEEFFMWNQHPWYENDNDGGPVKYNGELVTEVDIAFMMRVMPWHLTRSSQLEKIGNFQQFGTSKESTLVYDGYIGVICPMRELLIAARIFKYILDNDINDKVYDAIKDVKFSYDLYGSEQPDITLDVNEMSFPYTGGEQIVKVKTKDQAWTATVEGEGITVSPMEGPAGVETEVTITAAENTLASRTATVTFTTATGKAKTVDVIQQAAPTSATIKDFMVEYVKLIDVWKKNVGTVNLVYGIGAHGDANDYEDAHYIPDETVIKVGDFEYSLADGYELAARSYLLLRGYDGLNTTISGKNYPLPKLEEAYTVDNNLPVTHNYKWGANPYNESSGNGGLFKYTTEEGEFELVKVDILDDLSNRATNYPIKNGTISNLCGYPQSYLPAYSGAFCAKRQALAYAFFFKYMLDNNLQTAKDISEDQTFDAPLFYIAGAGAPTIKAFAQEYIKVLDIWQNTTGSVSYTAQTGVTEGGSITDAHYIPLDTKFEVAGVEYGTADMFEIALRSYLLLRGYDATATDKVGAGAFATLEAPWKMSDNFPATHGYAWGPTPYNEAGTTNANGGTTGNGGGLRMGTPAEGGVEKVKVDLLDNFAQRNTNYPLGNGAGKISNMSGYANKIPGYYGCMSAMRALYTYAQFFKYMLDNNLEDAMAVPADQTFDSYLFGEGKF